MHIDAYSFGRMVFDGRTYTSDLIIYPDGRVQDSWWRQSGHTLSVADIQTLADSRPQVVIAGTGASGIMKPDTEVKDFLKQRGIEFRALPTAEAVGAFNEIPASIRVGACFHLTC